MESGHSKTADLITGNHADGALTILTRVQKINSAVGDAHVDGEQGTILGSMVDDEADWTFSYSVRFDSGTDPVMIAGDKIAPLAEQKSTSPPLAAADDPFGIAKAQREKRAEILAKAEKALLAMEAVGVYPVAVREGWSLWCTTPHGWPACAFGVIKSSKQTTPHLWPGPWEDPFTAVVEGTAWLKAEGVIDF